MVRVSGRDAGSVLDAMVGLPRPEPRQAALRKLRDAAGELIDEGLVLWFPRPRSFTGEDVVEFQIHGGTAVRTALIRGLLASGCRPAGPGEFTRRAFLNDRLDLSRAEAIGDLVAAETDAQRRQALRQLDGALAGQVARWREGLIDALAYCEATLDFSDEDDVPVDLSGAVEAVVDGLHRDMERAIASARWGERVRDGFVVVLAGPPNAGKSTLLNALARREVAIVSARPGTTRDAIEVRCDLDGYAVTFVDTAGLRRTEDEVEALGIARSRSRIATADLVLWLRPPGSADDADAGPRDGAVLTVETKADLGPVSGETRRHDVAISALTGQGLDELTRAIAARLVAESGDADAVLTGERQRIAVEATALHLRAALRVLRTGQVELVAEALRSALTALAEVCGDTTGDDVLDRVFGSFCIGK